MQNWSSSVLGPREFRSCLGAGATWFFLESLRGERNRIYFHVYCSRMVLRSIICVFISSQKRGINIPLNCITRVRDGDEIKTKYWKRKGFAKAYVEMHGASTYVTTRYRTNSTIETNMLPKITDAESNKTTTKQQSNKLKPTKESIRRSPRRDAEPNKAKPKPKPIKESIRRSPRLEKQKPECSLICLRRSVRIEQKRAFNK